MAISTISSGTERANLMGDLNISIAREKPSVAVFPRRSGYSSSGTVVKTGEGVDSLVPGDRVAMSWTSHSQYVCKAERELTKLPDDISFEEAALWHIATFPLAAIRKCRLEIGESTVVMGMGVLGMMAVKLLRAAGASPIIAADPVAEKRKLALEIGADYALDPFAPDFVLRVGELTRGGAGRPLRSPEKEQRWIRSWTAWPDSAGWRCWAAPGIPTLPLTTTERCTAPASPWWALIPWPGPIQNPIPACGPPKTTGKLSAVW